MDRLTLIRRPKAGDKVECLPAGDGLPVWTTIPLDAKLPMMQNPKGSVILYTTKLGQPKHRCKQEYDFDLRDPNGKYISTIYQPLHDPHLKSYFNREVMRRHLSKKGFISDDGKVLCSLREFNNYRQYLRHIFFLEIAKERREELHRRAVADHKAELQRKVSRGTVIRKRLQQQREKNLTELKKKINMKTEKLENRLRAIREEMLVQGEKQREEVERRQLMMQRCQQEAEQRNQMLIKKLRQKDRLHDRLIEDREAQKKIQLEMNCLEKWNERKISQKDRLDRQGQIILQEDQFRIQNITQRERLVNRQRGNLEKKIESLKEMSRERKRKRDEMYAKRFEEKLASGDYRKWTKSRVREKRNKHRTFNSTWDLKEVLKNFQVSDAFIDKPEVAITEEDEEGLSLQAREIVSGIMDRVKNEIYPAFLRSIGEDDGLSNEASPSKSVRFNQEDPEESWTKVDINVTDADEDNQYRPVNEHVLTPCASQQKLDTDKLSSVSFVETLLLRLLDDLNSGRICKEDIMKLASYSMDIIQSTDAGSKKDTAGMDELEWEGATVLSSSSSIIAKKMVDFTLNRILLDIQSGNVHRDNLASLTVSLVDISDEGCLSLSISDADLDDYIDETIRAATSSAMDPREDSPVCEALLDNFMVNTLKKLMLDLEQETLSSDQIQVLAQAVKDETKILTDEPGYPLKDLRDIQLVLEKFLTQMKAGDIDSQSLYQIVFTIVYSYSIIKSAPIASYESKITDLLKDMLITTEEKATTEGIEHVNPNIVHEASDRLSHTVLDIAQIEEISSSIMTVSTKSDVICKTTSSEIARSIVEDALIKAKEQIERESIDQEMMEGIQNVAEAVILVLAPEARSPPLVNVFVEILEQLKGTIDCKDQADEGAMDDLSDLIDKIKSHSIGPDDVADMATAVAEIAKNPPKSDASVTAFIAVKNTLKTIRDDFAKGELEDDIIKEMIGILRFSCKNVISSDPKSPELLVCLAGFVRTILNLLSSKLRTGELDHDDLDELSTHLKETIETKSNKPAIEHSEHTVEDVDNTTEMIVTQNNVFDYLSFLIDNIETGEMGPDEIQSLGTKLIESGRALMASLSEKPSTINTDEAADGAVEEVLRTLQMEIESGVLTTDSLKEITKTILTSSSDSDFADDLIDGAIRSIERDVQRGYALKDISSIPTLDHSPSASTVASFVVMQTIEELRKNISASLVPGEMVGSIASSLVLFLSPEKTEIGNLPAEFEQYRNTIASIVACLRDDKMDSSETEKLFCLILERYKEFMSEDAEPTQEFSGLSMADSVLVRDLVSETLRNIEKSVASGKIFDKAFSIPSATSSHNTTIMADNIVERCLQTIKLHLQEEEDAKTQRPQVFVDFIIQIIEILQTELANGTISKLSMATFFNSISTDKSDLKVLENNAVENLAHILSDIKTNQSNSVFIDRILETYLTTDPNTFDTFSDPVKAVKSILVSVSLDILTKFVKATIENIIIDMQDGSTSLQRESSTHVLGDASTVVAKNVVKKVIEKVKEDLSGSLEESAGATIGKVGIERAASRLMTSSETPNSEVVPSPAQHSSTTSSKAVEDIVLESLHNIVSNLRLEQSIVVQDGQGHNTNKELESSQEIHDYVLQTLQNIVTDLQDKRAQIDIGALKTEGATPEVTSKESEQAAAYVNKILHTVLNDMKSEITTISNDSPNQKPNEMSSKEHEKSIIDTMIKAFFGINVQSSETPSESREKKEEKHPSTESIQASVQNGTTGSQKESSVTNIIKGASSVFAEDVVKTVLETIQNDLSVRNIEGTNAITTRVENSEEQPTATLPERRCSIINTMTQALSSSTLQKQNAALEQKQKEDIKQILMESIKSTILSVKEGQFDQEELMCIYESTVESLDEEVVQAAEKENGSMLQSKVLSLLMSLYLKMENLSVNDDMLDKLSSHLATVGMEITPESEETVNDVVCNSSEVSGLVKEIVAKISQQLVEVNNKEEPEVNGTTGDDGDPNSVDQNFNRRISESSLSTLNKDSSDSSSTSLNAVLPKRKVLGRGKTKSLDAAYSTSSSSTVSMKAEKKTNRRSLESQIPMQAYSPSKTEDRLLSRKPMPKPQISKTQTTHGYVRGGVNMVAAKVKKDTPIPAHCRSSRIPDKPIYGKTSSRCKTVYHGASTTTPTRGASDTKQRVTRTPKRPSPDLTRLSPETSSRKSTLTPTTSQPESPIELKSLCGVHKTRIRYRNIDDSTTDDGSYTSEIF